MNKTNVYYIAAGVVVLIGIFVLMYIFRGASPTAPGTTGGNFGAGENRSVTVGTSQGTNEPIPGQTALATTSAKVFKVNDGPVAGAILMQMGRPTTTVARFVMADSGHVFDIPLDSPGALARAVSNTTIPGIETAAWTTATGGKGDQLGSGVVLQYIDQNKIKTLELAFPAATTTLSTQAAVHLQFFPDGTAQVAASPDGKSVAYLVPTAAGADVYTASPNGNNGKRVASLTLSQVLLSWPSNGFILAQSPAASGVPGVVFSINASSGALEPIAYGMDLTATADRAFSHMVYQTNDGNTRSSWARDIASGLNQPLSFDPYPEKCTWGNAALGTLYCAAPLQFEAMNYLDLWHTGLASAPDSIFGFNVGSGAASILAVPGSTLDGGESSDIDTLSTSPDDHYLLFIRKGDRSLWAVRLSSQ